jgi:hypothetical protein
MEHLPNHYRLQLLLFAEKALVHPVPNHIGRCFLVLLALLYERI